MSGYTGFLTTKPFKSNAHDYDFLFILTLSLFLALTAGGERCETGYIMF